MKKLIIALAIFASVAHAEIIAVLRNRAGGTIALTDVSTQKCGSTSRAAYSTSPSNETAWGCWFLDDLMVHITWLDGKTWSYPVESFHILKNGNDRKGNNT